MINLENNGRLISKDITAYEAFVKVALVENFLIVRDGITNKQLDEIHEVYNELNALDLDISDLDYLIYNIQLYDLEIHSLSDFLKILVNENDSILEFVNSRE